MITIQQVVLAVLATALLCGADMTLAGSVAKRSAADGTCMSQWLRLASASSAAPVNISRLETSIYWVMVARKANSVSELEPRYLDIAIGPTAAQYLRFCLGNEANQTCKAASPCQSGGVCTFHPDPSKPKLDQFICICPNGLGGKYCEEVLPCTSTSCANGGSCVNYVEPAGSYGSLCKCPPGFTGVRCETEWISPDIIASITSSLARIAGEQKAVGVMLERFAKPLGNRITSFLAKLKEDTDSKFESSFTNLWEEVKALKAARNAVPVGTGVPQPVESYTQGVSPPGIILDRFKRSSRLTVSDNGRIVWNHSPGGDAAVLGRTGYIRGVHRWTFRIDGLVAVGGVGVGFTTLPVEGKTYERSWSPSTTYAWFSNQFSAAGLASSQTSTTAKMQRWVSGDVLTLSLNVEDRTMEMFHHLTKERKTIRGVNGGTKPLYLWLFVGIPGSRIAFLPNYE